MAQRLHLYDVFIDILPSPLDLQDDDVATAAAATAWGSFNFQMLMSMSYRREPLAKSLPNLPIPGEPSGNGSTSRPLPSYQEGYAFVCRLWAITFEMNYQYFYTGAVTLPAAELLFHKLLAWADDLIWFHTIVMDVFRPFSQLKPQPRLTTFADTNATPAKIVEASIKQLKRADLYFSGHLRIRKFQYPLSKRHAIPSESHPAQLYK
ncbi:hypothetical protein DM02DRAFT_664202 [Periconia macrospinosa]|uniref:Uncharacterized protein n=1 Tax=Periconia macrospinosa TaxID=97972 RepID=A0A2V1CZP9_9PLEO|nr:hypothetical protein DM02DRAFT_664202 [Periconia macrospinosa]